MVGREVHGRFDNVVYRQILGVAVLAHRPRPTVIPPTTRQREIRGGFKKAAGYAYKVFNDPAWADRKAAYQAITERRGFILNKTT